MVTWSLSACGTAAGAIEDVWNRFRTGLMAIDVEVECFSDLVNVNESTNARDPRDAIRIIFQKSVCIKSIDARDPTEMRGTHPGPRTSSFTRHTERQAFRLDSIRSVHLFNLIIYPHSISFDCLSSSISQLLIIMIMIVHGVMLTNRFIGLNSRKTRRPVSIIGYPN